LKEGKGKEIYTYRVLVELPEGSKPLGRHRGENNIKLKLQQDGRTYAGLIWLRIGTGGELL